MIAAGMKLPMMTFAAAVFAAARWVETNSKGEGKTRRVLPFFNFTPFIINDRIVQGIVGDGKRKTLKEIND